MSRLSKFRTAAKKVLSDVYGTQAPPTIKATSFRGAVHNRLTADWILARIESADAEVKGDLRTVRKRARELARNTPHAHRYTDLLRQNLVGESGQRLQSIPRTLDGVGFDMEASVKIEEAWARWTEKDMCSADGRLSFREIEELTLTSEAIDGESLVRMLPGFRNEFGFALQLIDPDQLDEEFNTSPDSRGTNEIRMGVEVNGWMRPVAYHIYDSHPFDYQGGGRRDRRRITARDILHNYQVMRAGQTRGISWLAPVMLDKEMLAALQEAELIASRIASAKSGVFEIEDAEIVIDPDDPSGGVMDFSWDMEPGVWGTLPPGVKAKFFDPQHPNSAFGEFNKIILRTISVGLMTSYASLTGDYADVNFSSLRAATISERDGYKLIQNSRAANLNTPIFRHWLKWALTTGRIDLPISQIRRYERHTWQARGFQWVDPLKDMKAAEISIALGLDTRTRLAASLGRHYPDIIAELAREEAMADKAGVSVDGLLGALDGPDDDDDPKRIAELLESADEDMLHAISERLNGSGSRISRALLAGGVHE